jgi:hypothetical protein
MSGSRPRKKRQLTKAELRAMGGIPGVMAHRVGPDGRARLEQLTADGSGRSSFFYGEDQTAVRSRRRRHWFRAMLPPHHFIKGGMSWL